MKRVGSYGIIVIFYLSYSREWSLILFPSIEIFPDSISMILVKAREIVLFPAPVLPTIPTLCPPSILKERPLSTFSVVGLYLTSTSSNSMQPWLGHYLSSIFIYPVFSWGISRIYRHLWIPTIFFSRSPMQWKNPIKLPWRLRTYENTIASRTGSILSLSKMHVIVENASTVIEIIFIWVEYQVKVPIAIC